jgi:hypothetical protein
MKNTLNTFQFFAATLLIAVLFSNCEKAASVSKIQQGNTVIEINAIFPSAPESSLHFLQVRINDVINAPINVMVTFHLTNGQQKNIPVTIPAGYKHLVSWGDDHYINTMDYSGYTDSTGNGSTPIVDASWDVSSVEITAVSCPDKEYGFKVLTGEDEWTFYKPTGPETTVHFIVNKDTVSYTDHDFNTDACLYSTDRKTYSFIFFFYRVSLYSSTATYPLHAGMEIDIPAMAYKWNSRYYGSQPDNADSASNGSTLQLTVTNVTDTHFDAIFSGKLWSSRQPDTLVISGGEIKNALLPDKVDN